MADWALKTNFLPSHDLLNNVFTVWAFFVFCLFFPSSQIFLFPRVDLSTSRDGHKGVLERPVENTGEKRFLPVCPLGFEMVPLWVKRKRSQWGLEKKKRKMKVQGQETKWHTGS